MKTKKNTDKKSKQIAPTRPATPQETVLLSEIHAEIASLIGEHGNELVSLAAESLRDEIKEENEKLRGQNARLREKEKELESEIKSAEGKLMEINHSLSTKSAENSAADLVLKQKEQILFGDFSDLVVHDSWLEGTVNASASYHETRVQGPEYTTAYTFKLVLLRIVETGMFFKENKTIGENITVFTGVPKQLFAEFSLKTKRLALAVNQKIARRANLAPESARPDDYGANFDPLEEFKKKNNL